MASKTEKIRYSVNNDSVDSASSIEEPNDNPFAHPQIAAYWRKIYEDVGYENLHRFDPDFTWNKEEEKKLVRRLDLKVFSWTFVMFCALDLVRRNINRAVSDNLVSGDIPGLDTNGYNLGQTIYLISFLCAELPLNLLSKKFGPNVVVSAECLVWSIICISQSAMRTRAQFLALRALLGFAQGGFIPDQILYLSYYYTNTELPLRLAIFWTAIPLFQILGSLLASGLLEMRGIHGKTGWQWLFIIEGLMSLGVAIPSFYMMRSGPTQTKNILFKSRPAWFNEHEEKILVNRLLRDDPAKGDMNNRQALNIRQILRTVLSEYDFWPLYIQGLMAFIPFQPVTAYMSLILRSMGYSVFLSNVLAIPGQFWFLINLPLVVYFSHRVKEKSICVGIANYFIFPFVVALVAYPATGSDWVKYFLLTGIVALPYTHAILASWVSHISNNVASRSVATPLYNMMYQVGSIAASNIYRESDKPYYIRGNKIILGITVFNCVFPFFTKAYYIMRNKQKEKKWNSMTKEEQIEYTTNTTDSGVKRLDFRFVH
ncbi:hypothetical protein LJB42_004702 [Komagataella kurtzmanii]|nr:hypothetical protein LJB42_004702 [Komagataella kurtzmanii]